MKWTLEMDDMHNNYPSQERKLAHVMQNFRIWIWILAVVDSPKYGEQLPGSLAYP